MKDLFKPYKNTQQIDENLKKTINTFWKEINGLCISDRVMIAGSYSLHLHGLNLGDYLPKDLDLVVFNPSERQEDLLEKFEMTLDYGIGGENDAVSYKLDRDDLVLNVIVARGLLMRTGLLSYLYSGNPAHALVFRVANVGEVVAYKTSYYYKSSGAGIAYTRRKDVLHLQELKNFNFNYGSDY